jgi:hypothetical protein
MTPWRPNDRVMARKLRVSSPRTRTLSLLTLPLSLTLRTATSTCPKDISPVAAHYMPGLLSQPRTSASAPAHRSSRAYHSRLHGDGWFLLSGQIPSHIRCHACITISTLSKSSKVMDVTRHTSQRFARRHNSRRRTHAIATPIRAVVTANRIAAATVQPKSATSRMYAPLMNRTMIVTPSATSP